MPRRALGIGGTLVLLAACATAPTPPALGGLLAEGERGEAQGDPAAAGYYYAKAVRTHPDHSAAWAYYGEHHRFRTNDLRLARDAFERALSARNQDPASVAFAWRGLGELAHKRGDVAAAIAALERSLSIRPSADAHRSLASILATERADFDASARHARAAVAADGEDPIALVQLAVAEVRAGNPAAARASFERAISIVGCDELGGSDGPVHCCVLYNGACYHAVRGDSEAALAMLREFFRAPNHRHITRAEIVRDPDLRSLRAAPEFRSLLDEHLQE